MEKTHTSISSLLSKKKPGSIIFPSDFRGKGTEAAIKKALSRLAQAGAIRRLGHGIYYIPRMDAVLGELPPSAEEVIQTIAKKEKVKIRPAGAYALHRLGLTTQVPTKMVYITSGHPREFSLGRLRIKFKATTPKKLATIGKFSSLVIQALEELGTDRIDPQTATKIAKLLSQESPKTLQHDLSLTPARINDFIVKLLRKETYDRVVTADGSTKESNT